MRALSDEYMHDLKDVDGTLHPVLERVKQDDALMLAIRDDYINIHYRGGNLLRVRRVGPGRYDAWFDLRYNKSEQSLSLPCTTIASAQDAVAWIGKFSQIKDTMDRYLVRYRKPEREFQQLIVRENNRSFVSNASEYFVSDIEYSDSSGRERADMLAVRWRAHQRGNGASCRAALFEVKYGDAALGGKSGLLDHLRNMDALVTDRCRYRLMLRTIESQFAQLDDLGLLSYTHAKRGATVQLDPADRPEVILILANHNPRSGRLLKILEDAEVVACARSLHYDLRFFVSSFSGYALHCANMLDLQAFGERVRLQLDGH
ncbi:MAG: hypothetical protein R6X16_16340 [Anaerolineae bacterium]